MISGQVPSARIQVWALAAQSPSQSIKKHWFRRLSAKWKWKDSNLKACKPSAVNRSSTQTAGCLSEEFDGAGSLRTESAGRQFSWHGSARRVRSSLSRSSDLRRRRDIGTACRRPRKPPPRFPKTPSLRAVVALVPTLSPELLGLDSPEILKRNTKPQTISSMPMRCNADKQPAASRDSIEPARLRLSVRIRLTSMNNILQNSSERRKASPATKDSD